jgi:hypothetical protein
VSVEEFVNLIDELLNNAPDGINESVLEHLTEAKEAVGGEEPEMSPGQQAAKEAMPEDSEEEMPEESGMSPGQMAAAQAAIKKES